MINFAELTSRPITHNDCKELVNSAIKNQLTLTDGLKLYCFSYRGIDVALCGYVIKGKTGILKFEYVDPAYIRKGILAKMIQFRIGILKKRSVKKIIVNCMPMSINSHLKAGAKIVTKYKYGGCQVVYENL